MSDFDGEVVELAGPPRRGWYYTQIPDWIMLHPQVTHTAYRLYSVMRSLVIEKDPKVRVLSHDELAFLLPGAKGKPCSVDAIKDALRALGEAGLVVSDRRVTSTGRGGIQTRYRYEMRDWPADADSHEGWRNAFDKLDSYTPDWRETRTDVCAGPYVSGKKPRRNDLGEHAATEAETGVSAGRFVSGKKPSERGKKPGGKAVTSKNATLKKSFKNSSSSSVPSEPLMPPPRPDEEEDEIGIAHPVAAVIDATGATAEEAQSLVAEIRQDPRVRSVAAYVAKLITTGDMQVRLERMRAAASRVVVRPSDLLVCSAHRVALPCGACRGDVLAGDREVPERLLAEHGPGARPDLVQLLGVEESA